VSITPASDLVLDVAMAADPAKRWAATEKLATGGTVSPVERTSFDLVLESAVSNAPDSRSNLHSPSTTSANPQKSRDEGAKAYKGLEQLVLKNLLETLLPKNSSVLFGSSTAGEVWRSMLADQLASEFGKTVDLGCARRNKTASFSVQGGGANNQRHISASDITLDNAG